MLLQSCPTLCSPMNCSLPGSSLHGILQARILEWVAMPSPRGSSCPRDWTCISYISCIGKQILYSQGHLGSPHYLHNLKQSMINFLLIKWIKKGMFIGTQGSPLSSLILLTVFFFVVWVFVFWLFPNILHGGGSCLSPLSILWWLQVLLTLTLHTPFHLLSHVPIHSLTHPFILSLRYSLSVC